MNIFELYGQVGMKGLEQVDKELSGLEKRTQKVQKGMKVMGAAFTGAGAAGLAIISSTKKINAGLSVTAKTLGTTTKKMRDLTLATTNVTFPISEVTATFDLLARAGVKDEEILKSVATAFDTLGDAIDMAASDVTAKLVPTMKTFNLTAEEVAGKTDAMTYLFRNTTVSLDDFNRMVGYVTPDLVEMGLTTEDMIGILADLEKQGYSGEVMTREFRKAVTLATKEQIPLNEALGISEDTIGAYKKQLKGATGLTQEYADEANSQYTIMDKVKQKWSELTLKASAYLEPLEPIMGAMTALGPLMMMMGSSAGTAAVKWALHTIALIAHKVASLASAIAIKAVTVAQWLWNAAISANPIGLLIIAIAAMIAAGVLLWKNWDKVVKFFKTAWGILVNIFKKHWDKILAVLFPAVGLPILIARNWGKIVGAIKNIWNKVVEWFRGIPKKLGDIFAGVTDLILAPFRVAWAGIGEGINWLIRQLNKIKVPSIKIGPFKTPGWGGLNLSPISLPKFARGGLIPEPTVLYGLRSQRPYALAGEAGIEHVGPGAGGQTITNEFNIAQLVVREEADIPRIARELYHLQQLKVRATGG